MVENPCVPPGNDEKLHEGTRNGKAAAGDALAFPADSQEKVLAEVAAGDASVI